MEERPIGYYFLGLALSIVGSILIPVGVIFQKQTHDRKKRVVDGVADDSPKETTRVGYLAEKRWWGGLVLYILGNLFVFAAFAFCPNYIVTVIGAFTLVVNLILSKRMLGETYRWPEIAACVCIIVGVVVSVIAQQPGLLGSAASGSATDTMTSNVSLPATLFVTTTTTAAPTTATTTAPIGVATRLTSVKALVLTAAMVVVSGALAVFAHVARTRHTRLAKAAQCVSSAVCGVVTVVFTKVLSTMLVFGSHTGDAQGGELSILSWQGAVITALVLTSMVMQLKLLNDSLKINDILFHAPVFFVTLQLLSVVAGVVVFDEMRALTPLQTFLFCVGSFVLLGGVALTSLRLIRSSPNDDALHHDDTNDTNNHSEPIISPHSRF